MKHILFLLLFLPVLAYAQFPANPNKIRLGNQTTADGLVVRTAASPSWTPSTINNAWLAFDTVAVKLYYYDGGAWNEYTGGSEITDVSVSNDTLYITTTDSTFVAVFDDANTNFANSNLTFTGNRVHNLSTRTLTIADGGTYPTFQQSAATDGFTLASSATDLIAQTPGLLQIENSDTITITADRIRMNAADTRVQQVSKDNALNRVMMLDSLTGQVYYRDVSSIAGGGGTVTGTGTTNTLPKWTSSTALGNSLITDDGTGVAVGGTSALRLPNGTTAQRPGSGSAGMLRYNTSNGNLDFYGASAWENPVKSTNATGLGTAQYVGFYDANGRLTGGNAGLRFITSPYPYIQYGQSVNLTDNTLFYWLNGYSESRNISNNSGATRTAETGAWRVVATPTGNNAFSNFNGANVIALTGSTHVGGSIIRAGRFEASNSAGAGASTMVGAIGRAANASTNGATSLSGFLSEVVNTAGTTPLAYGGTTSVINTATLTNTYGWHVGDITSGTQTNTPRSFYAEDGNAINVFNGSTMMGTDATPSRTLHVTGEARITDLTTDTPTRIVGADADGDLGQMTLGGNLTITSGMLSADNTNLTLADEGNGVRILSSTGTDVDLLEDSGVYITRSGNAAYFGKYMDYGEASIFGAQTLAFLAGSTSYDTLSGYTEQQVGNFVLQGGALKYTGSRTIIARVTASISLSFPETGTIFAGFRQNTSSITKSRAQHKAAADEPTNISLTCILTIAPNDLIRIELAPGAHTGDDNITVTNCNFNITEL